MKKIILALITLCLLSCFVYAENSSDTAVYDFTAKFSEDAADMLGVKVKDGFNVSVINGSLSTVSSFGIPVTFTLEDGKAQGFGSAVFMLKCGYFDEKSVITVKCKNDKGEVIATSDFKITNKNYTLYCAPLAENTHSLEIFVNSVEPTMDMYSVDLDYIRLYKSSKPVLLTIDSTSALVGSETKTLDSPALIKDGFTLTPARFVAENAGAKVEWIGAERKVVITKDETVIELVIDNTVAKVNGKEINLDVAPCIINDFTYTPARFIAENLGCSVEWEPTHRTVTVLG